jgi:hypothetical protein
VEEPEPGLGRPTGRAKAILVAVVAILVVATMVLCCAAVGQLGELMNLRLPPP